MGFPGGSDGLQFRRPGFYPLGWEDPLEEGIATYSSILAWGIPWTEEPDRLQSTGAQRVWHDWAFPYPLCRCYATFLILHLIEISWCYCHFCCNKQVFNESILKWEKNDLYFATFATTGALHPLYRSVNFCGFHFISAWWNPISIPYSEWLLVKDSLNFSLFKIVFKILK